MHHPTSSRRVDLRLTLCVILAFAPPLLAPASVRAQVPLVFEPHVIESDAVLWWARSLGDINGDGLLDLAVHHNNGHGGWLGWYEASGGGTAWQRHVIAQQAPGGGTFACGAMDAADLDGDGDRDLLGCTHPGEWKQEGAASEIYWFENPQPQGDPASTPWRHHLIGRVPAFVKDMKLADFNGDGRQDLVAITFVGNRLLVFRQDRPSPWTNVLNITVPNLHEGLDVGDITGSGWADVATNGYWLESPGGDLTQGWQLRSVDEKWHNQTGDWSRNATKVACRDITGDGRAEIFISHSERSDYPVSWYHAPDPRSGPWQEHLLTDRLAAVHTLQVADVDGDGHQDVLAGVNRSRAQALGRREFPVILFRNLGDNLQWEEVLLTQEGIYNGQIGDVQGDGRPDIVRLATHDATTCEILINQPPRPSDG